MELYYIQNRGYCGNCVLWWRHDRCGYTVNLDEALKVPKEEAESICSDRPYMDHMWPADQVDAHAQRHASCEMPPFRQED